MHRGVQLHYVNMKVFVVYKCIYLKPLSITVAVVAISSRICPLTGMDEWPSTLLLHFSGRSVRFVLTEKTRLHR